MNVEYLPHIQNASALARQALRSGQNEILSSWYSNLRLNHTWSFMDNLNHMGIIRFLTWMAICTLSDDLWYASGLNFQEINPCDLQRGEPNLHTNTWRKLVYYALG